MTATSGSTIIDLQARKLLCERDDRVLFEQLDVAVGGNGDCCSWPGHKMAPEKPRYYVCWRSGTGRLRRRTAVAREPLTDDFSAYASQRLISGHLAAVKKRRRRWRILALAGQRSWNVSDDQLWGAPGMRLSWVAMKKPPVSSYPPVGQRARGSARLWRQRHCGFSMNPFTALLDKAGVRWLEGRSATSKPKVGWRAVIITSHHALENTASLVPCVSWNWGVHAHESGNGNHQA